MAESQDLLIELHDRPVATLTPVPVGGHELIYLPEVVQQFQGRYLLSVSLPVRAQAYEPERAAVFLGGLLPEGRVRERLCRRFRIGDDDVIGLLREIGRDCAGAISIIPLDQAEENRADDGVEWLTEDQLEELIAELPIRPLGIAPEDNVRISLAGAQDKLPVVIAGDRVGLPRGSTPSTHILKPASTETTRRGRIIYPGLVENEAFCLCLARRSGLEAVAVEVRRYGVPTLVLKRYDRYEARGRTRRIHQEDVCQALGTLSNRKYEDDGGPGAVQVIELLRQVSEASASDMLTFLRRLAFAHLTGNLDAHAKNTSLLYMPDGLRLAPLYDTLSTVVYPHLSKRLAIRIGGQSQADQVTSRHWIDLLEEAGMNSAGARRELAAFARRVLGEVVATREEVRGEGFGHPVIDEIEAYMRRRAAALLDLPDYASHRHPKWGRR